MNIFCHKCGERMSVGDEFCQFCGAKVHSQHAYAKPSEQKHLTRESLEKKPWYRGLKVFYIIVVAIVVLIIGAASISSLPTKVLDDSASSINCDNGNSYTPNKNSIFLYGKELDSYADGHARILCKYNTTAYYSSLYSGYIEKNYTFVPVYEEVDYDGWGWNTVLAFVIAAIILKVIRMGFFYIVIGEKPKFGSDSE